MRLIKNECFFTPSIKKILHEYLNENLVTYTEWFIDMIQVDLNHRVYSCDMDSIWTKIQQLRK